MSQMDQELLREWQELQETAREILRKGYAPATRLFQVIRCPAFEDAISWEIFEVAPAPTIYRAAKMQWLREQDSEKFRNPVERLKYPRPLKPSIETNVNALRPEFVQSILEQLKAVQIPAWPSASRIGLDGTMYELIVGGGFLSVHYRWWEQPPIEWQPLADISQAIVDQIEANL